MRRRPCGRHETCSMVSNGPRIVALAVFWAELQRGAHAWDKDGHEAIGMTTMSALQPEPVAQVKRLMHGHDAVEVSAWAHKVNKKYPWTLELHFQRQPERRCRGADLSVCPDNKCLVKALNHFYGRLVNKPTVDIDWGKGIKLTDADCLKYLINLIGDLHQPMHFGLAGEKDLMVYFRGKTVSMFDIWDSEITQATIKESPGFWWGGWTHVQRTRVEYENDGARWKKDGVQEFERWANETVEYLCDHIYKNPMTGEDMLPQLQSGNFRLSEGLFQQWKREMLSKMLVAGARTAIVLNSILAHREGMEQLHGGTAVSGVEEGDEELASGKPVAGRKSDMPRGVKPTQGFSAFGINVLIFLTTQFFFLWLMRIWRGKDKVAQADRAKHGAAEGGKKT
eukprot:TRINITY_DN83414_c0_g1_i1.p1 TRINITY_DN83414_c0_g1~~TRINITY_DN83414_c0_g1_i1.p1  ORF type:complete len:395 (-),score=96.98 TRINITY_DN83414_c0_g1_i1:198-1382(-)